MQLNLVQTPGYLQTDFTLSLSQSKVSRPRTGSYLRTGPSRRDVPDELQGPPGGPRSARPGGHRTLEERTIVSPREAGEPQPSLSWKPGASKEGSGRPAGKAPAPGHLPHHRTAPSRPSLPTRRHLPLKPTASAYLTDTGTLTPRRR